MGFSLMSGISYPLLHCASKSAFLFVLKISNSLCLTCIQYTVLTLLLVVQKSTHQLSIANQKKIHSY